MKARLLKTIKYLLILTAVSGPILVLGVYATINYNLHRRWNSDHAHLEDRPRGDKALCLILGMDGIPHSVMLELKKEGYFRTFYEPSRMVSVFPSITKPSFSRIWKGGTPYGYERLYYDRHAGKIMGFSLLEKALSTPKVHEDYKPGIDFLGFPGYISYVFPNLFTNMTMKTFARLLQEHPNDRFVAYIGLTDPIAHIKGKESLKEFLRKFDRQLTDIVESLPFRLDMVLFSDHGNDFMENRPVDLSTPLEKAGFLDAQTLKAPKDFILLRNGFVSAAAIYTAPRNCRPMSRIISRAEGVEHCFYASGDTIYVLQHDDEAVIQRRGNRYRYHAIEGDPLAFKGIVARMKIEGKIDTAGYTADSDWWDMTKSHHYPDALKRIWQAFHGLVQHPANILVSMKAGYAFGPEIFNLVTPTSRRRLIYALGTEIFDFVTERVGTHGSLRFDQTNGFVMTNINVCPPYLRPEHLREIVEGTRQMDHRTAVQRHPD